ncbi:acryloyl-CoA reductase [Staphylococcus epidermidis]|jgi:putative quinone oxidoreductase, yhdH/yhfP family|uniref:Alcohol dehydrogenase, zinc-containing n=8 Tax=Staphylococcus TaxID=1279 RepID=Q5HLM3_STAEQ|nr:MULTISPECIES: acryloyl-CoA reductase [Staphylococcus]EHR94206.1 quinone oxidoreductase, YhdH/YhfP family [Staphylococcus epidermidis VCU123]EJD80126.1 quinone oxidoreductase, YhdH/YhfP family [Staphylococcus epidermidis NIHLM088]EJD85586.1 quinone oxidoreductase, YhdH/YhfP family [Staphylococcus epidermidis NIHLM070]EON81534.1 alcohol dehydrogenase [Staphylococcus epidermidis 528m]EON83018.1 alcohol dehydrogenase [Staphylococcus epidermidis 41tr]EON85253.1 alcohol dehydrogenase [Staphyloco
MVEKFKAFVVDQDDNGIVSNSYKELTKDDLPEGDVLIKVHYSGINYKDALATQDHNKIVKQYPMVPGIDLAGTIEETNAPGFEVGDKVIVTSYDLGVSHYGGFSEYARVKSEWVIELPEDLTLEEAMIYGTAGYTAGLAIEQLEKSGMSIEGKEVLVRGATGGVGTISLLMLNNLGYDVIASTGRDDAEEKLKKLGAKEVIGRLPEDNSKPLEKRTWQAAIDPVGGENLPYIVKRLDNNGSVALIGMTGGNNFETTVFPFILRGASIIGIDSVFTPIKLRKRVWRRLAKDLKPQQLHDIKHVISFDEIPKAIDQVINHNNTGRIVIDFNV